MEAALGYAAMGWAVFPLQPKGKEPLDGSRGFKDATTDQEKIRKWWGRHPDMNIGLATGAASGGIVAVDVDENDDRGKHGMDTLTEWERGRGELPETAMSITGSGGYHILLRVEGACPCSTNADKAVDIRGDGGYIVLPPSVHPNGNRYEWECDPSEFPVADADANAKAFIESVRPHNFGMYQKFDVPNAIPEGQRDETIFKLAASMRANGIDPDMIESVCQAVNADRCMPPLSAAKVRAKVRSACRYKEGHSEEFKAKVAQESTGQQRQPGRPRKFQHNEVARRLMDERRACFIDGMPAVWSGGRYRMGWPAVDAAVIDEHDDCTEANRREVRAYLTAKAPRVKQSPLELVAFANGVLDVRTMELRPWRDDDVIPNIIPHAWNPDAECPEVDAAIEAWACGDGVIMANLMQVAGMCMCRSAVRFGAFPVLIGSGANGKSTYIELLGGLLGDENVSGIQPHEIGQRFQAEALVGKLANLADDIKGGHLDAEACGAIKRIATGNILHTDVKGGRGFDFHPYATMVLSANSFPTLADTTDGMTRRLFPIAFRASFKPGGEGYDPEMGSRLATEAAYERMCVLGIDGLRLTLESGLIPNSQSKAILDDITLSSSTVLQWLADSGLAGGGLAGWTKDQAYDAYGEWCDRNGYGRTKVGSRNMVSQIDTFEGLSLTGFRRLDVGERRVMARIFAKK